MSSEKDVTVEPLQLKGRGKLKEKPAPKDDNIIRKVRSDHGYGFLISFPNWIGLKMNQEVTIEKRGTNPLNWEIVIKPIIQKRQRLKPRK